MRVEIADPLIEKSVRLAVAGGPEESEYHRQREALYDIEDAEDRERAFRALHRRWFLSSKLEDPFWEALAEVPGVRDGVARWCVSAAARASEEGAELYVSPDEVRSPSERRSLVLRLLPETLVDRPRLLWLLRRELLHAADMVDPAFGYRPQLPPSAAGPVYDDLLRQRYAVLWSTSVHGRLERRGRAPRRKNEVRTRFLDTFSMLGEQAEEIFERLYCGERPGHDELVRLALEPSIHAGRNRSGGRCPLCGLPTHVCETAASLEAEVVAYLRVDKPGWNPEQGLCPHCADLYRVRSGVFARRRQGGDDQHCDQEDDRGRFGSASGSPLGDLSDLSDLSDSSDSSDSSDLSDLV